MGFPSSPSRPTQNPSQHLVSSFRRPRRLEAASFGVASPPLCQSVRRALFLGCLDLLNGCMSLRQLVTQKNCRASDEL